MEAHRTHTDRAGIILRLRLWADEMEDGDQIKANWLRDAADLIAPCGYCGGKGTIAGPLLESYDCPVCRPTTTTTGAIPA